MTVLADKEQALVRTILPCDMPTLWACLAGVVRIYLDAERTGQYSFVGNEALQLGKGPFGGMMIGLALFRGQGQKFLAFAPLLRAWFALSNTSQVFQTNEGVGMGVNDALGNGVIRVQLKPSLSSAEQNTLPRGRASALLPKSFLQASHMVRLSANLLPTVELRLVCAGSDCRQIAAPHIYPNNGLRGLRSDLWHLDFQGNEQIVVLLGLIIPELGGSDLCPILQKGNMFVVALIGDMQTALKRQQADLLPDSQRIIAAIAVGKGRRDIGGWFIQALKAFLGPTCGSCFLVFAPFRPQPLVGCPDLTGDVAGHLRGQAKLRSQIMIRLLLKTQRIARFAMQKRVPADHIQAIAVGQLGLPQEGELVGRRLQFQFGGQLLLHQKKLYQSLLVFVKQQGARILLP